MSRCCAKPSHSATARPSSTSGSAKAVRRVKLWRMRARSALADKPDDVLGRLHGLGGDGAGAGGAVGEDLIDMAGVGHQPLHLGGDRRQLCYAEFDQCVLEIRKLAAAEFAEHLGP